MMINKCSKLQFSAQRKEKTKHRKDVFAIGCNAELS